jgi:hypothetical protein
MEARIATHTELLLVARSAYVRRDWHACYEAFMRAGENVPLSTDYLDALVAAVERRADALPQRVRTRLLDHRLVAASRGLEDVNHRAAGEGYYQLGEVRRRRGDADGAFAAFAQARASGVEPQPGEALLRRGQRRHRHRGEHLRPARRRAGPGVRGGHAGRADQAHQNNVL